jgi:hypothetical protein
MKRNLIDLNVFTAAEWDKNKEAIEFLEKAKSYEVYEPLFFVYHIARRWEYKKWADKIFKRIDELKSRIMFFSELNEKIRAKCELSLKELTVKAIKKLKIKTEDFWLVLSASVSNALLVIYNRKDLKDKEKEINDFLKENNLDAIEIILPSELLSSNTKLSFNPPSNIFLPFFSYFKPRNFFSHSFNLRFGLFKFSILISKIFSSRVNREF